MPPTWSRRHLRIPTLHGATDGPFSSHWYRDVALNHNVAKAYILRPTLVADVYQRAISDRAAPDGYWCVGGTAPGTVLITYSAGRGPVPLEYDLLAGHIVAEVLAGSAPAPAASKVTLVIASDTRPFDGRLSDDAATVDVTVTVAGGLQRIAFSDLPLRCDASRFTYLTVLGFTDGGAVGGKPPVDDYGILYGLQVYAYNSAAT